MKRPGLLAWLAEGKFHVGNAVQDEQRGGLWESIVDTHIQVCIIEWPSWNTAYLGKVSLTRQRCTRWTYTELGSLGVKVEWKSGNIVRLFWYVDCKS